MWRCETANDAARHRAMSDVGRRHQVGTTTILSETIISISYLGPVFRAESPRSSAEVLGVGVDRGQPVMTKQDLQSRRNRQGIDRIDFVFDSGYWVYLEKKLAHSTEM